MVACASYNERPRGAQTSSPSGPIPKARLMSIAAEAAAKRGFEQAFVFALIENETRFDCSLLGAHGEVGCGQMKESTFQDLVHAGEVRGDLWDPRVNIEATVAYLSFLRTRFDDAHYEQARRRYGLDRMGVLAGAYNGGPGHMARSLQGREELRAPVLAYVQRLKRNYARFGGKDS